MLRGADLSALWPQALALVILAVGSMGVALFALRRRLERLYAAAVRRRSRGRCRRLLRQSNSPQNPRA